MHKWLPIAALVLSVVVLAAHQGYLQPWTLDDAYITFRYSRNLAEGHGAVFNPGERVEGYTSFLWMAIMAAAHLVGANIVVASKIVGGGVTLAWFAALAAAHRWIRGLDPLVTGAALALCGTVGLASRWSMSGMETPLVLFFVVVGLGLHLMERGGDERPWLPVLSGVVAALAFMSRPDAGLLFGAIFLDRVLIQRRYDARLLSFLAPFLLLGGGWWAARAWWYGWLLPNTFYVKVGSSVDQIKRGVEYFAAFAMPGWPLTTLFALGVWKGRLTERNPGLWTLVLFTVLHLLYVLMVGGDVFWGWRFMVVVTVPMAVIGAIGLADVVGFDRRPRLAWGALVLLVGFQTVYLNQSRKLNHRGWVARTGVLVGVWLDEHTDEDALIAVNIAGSIPYYAKRPTIDMLGLNDAHIAHTEVPNMGKGRAGHEKGDGEYVLSRAPDVVMLSSAKGGRRPRFRSDRLLFGLDDFHEQYTYKHYMVREDKRIGVYVRKEEYGGKGIHGVRPVKVFRDIRLEEDIHDGGAAPGQGEQGEVEETEEE